MRNKKYVHGMAIGATLIFVSSACAGVQYFGSKQSWQEAVDWWITIDFVQPEPVMLTDQYAHLGAIFDGNAGAGQSQFTPSGDGWVMVSGTSIVEVELTIPRMWFGIEMEGFAYAKLYAGDRLLVDLEAGPIFTGVILDEPFDRIVFYNGVFIDNLYYGGIPAPGALSVLVLGLLSGGRRRRA